MNAAGIAVFYGAFDIDTCLAEVRPPVGSHVVVGEFRLLRPMQLLNFGRLASMPFTHDPFDPEHQEALERWTFLRSLSQRFSMPVMPGVEEFEYLLTQMACEYIGEVAAAEIDGIIFPSAQRHHATSNVALFERASVVESWEVPEGTTMTYCCHPHREEEDAEHIVTEMVPRTSAKKARDELPWDLLDWNGFPPGFKERDFAPSLALPRDGITVIGVKAVSYTREDRPVKVERQVQIDSDDEPPF
jgi:hypothetical protein